MKTKSYCGVLLAYKINYLFFNSLISRFLTWSSGTKELVFKVELPPWVTTKKYL